MEAAGAPWTPGRVIEWDEKSLKAKLCDHSGEGARATQAKASLAEPRHLDSSCEPDSDTTGRLAVRKAARFRTLPAVCGGRASGIGWGGRWSRCDLRGVYGNVSPARRGLKTAGAGFFGRRCGWRTGPHLQLPSGFCFFQ